MQWKSLDRSTQVWLEINLVSVVTWGWWYRRTITHYQECALEESLLQTYSKWQANGDWFGEGGLLSMYPTCWGFLRSCWSVQIGSSCQLLSVCTQGYGSAPHSAYSNLFLWGPLAFPWLYEVRFCKLCVLSFQAVLCDIVKLCIGTTECKCLDSFAHPSWKSCPHFPPLKKCCLLIWSPETCMSLKPW